MCTHRFPRPLAWLPVLLAFTTPLWLSPSLIHSSPAAGELREIRHASHPDAGFSRVVFELKGDGQLEVLPANRRGGVVYLNLMDAEADPGKFRCHAAGRRAEAPFADAPGAALCVAEGDLIDSIELRQEPDRNLFIAIHLRETRAGEISFRRERLAGSLRRPADRGISRLVIDLRRGVPAGRGGVWRKLPEVEVAVSSEPAAGERKPQGEIQSPGEGIHPAKPDPAAAFPPPPPQNASGPPPPAVSRIPTSVPARAGEPNGKPKTVLGKTRMQPESPKPAVVGVPAERAPTPKAVARKTPAPERASGATPTFVFQSAKTAKMAKVAAPAKQIARPIPESRLAQSKPAAPAARRAATPPKDEPPAVSPALMRPLQAAVEGNTRVAALQGLRAAADLWFPEIGADFPDWAKRIEFTFDVEGGDLEFSILTVQPLYQPEDKVDTLFTQLRLGNLDEGGATDPTINAGIGYRRLLYNNSVLAGLNFFYDVDTEDDHRRWSVGTELKFSAFDLKANFYDAITARHSVGNGVDEEALSGYDFEVTSQVPYLPWARVHYSRSFWNSTVLKNLEGYRIGAELDLHPNLQFETGYADDNLNKNYYFAKFRLRFADTKRQVASRWRGPDTVPFRARDMRDQTLVKVRRENRIVVKKVGTTVSGGAVVIVRND